MLALGSTWIALWNIMRSSGREVATRGDVWQDGHGGSCSLGEIGTVRSLSNKSEPVQDRAGRAIVTICGVVQPLLQARRISQVTLYLVVQIGAIYLILQAYSFVRRSIWQRPPDVAFDHALQVIDLQRLVVVCRSNGWNSRCSDLPWIMTG